MVIRRAAISLAAGLLLSSCAFAAVTNSRACSGKLVIAEFNQIGDLVANANVQSSDVVIGRIQEIERAGWNARVTLCLDEDEQFSADVHAVVRTTSLLGEKFVDLQVQSPGPPYLEDGAVIGIEDTSKATELEDVFAKLASILGTGNLEQLNRFTAAQANILRDNTDEVREVLDRLHRFTDVLAERKDQIASSIDSLDSVAQTLLDDSTVLEEFLASFADSSGILAEQRRGLQNLLRSLDRFSAISVQLLRETEFGLNKQFADLRPVLRTVVANSEKLREGLQTLATFVQWFPETMPGDYLQLDVCQAAPEDFGQGPTCPQDISDDDPDRVSTQSITNAIEFILNQPLRGRR